MVSGPDGCRVSEYRCRRRWLPPGLSVRLQPEPAARQSSVLLWPSQLLLYFNGRFVHITHPGRANMIHNMRTELLLRTVPRSSSSATGANCPSPQRDASCIPRPSRSLKLAANPESSCPPVEDVTHALATLPARHALRTIRPRRTSGSWPQCPPCTLSRQ